MQRILLAPALAALIASSATAGMIITWTETDTALTGSLTINGSNLLTDHPLSATTFGDIITLDGSALVTYVNGNSISAVPEVTSSFTMLGLIGSGLLLRRRGRKEL